MSWAIAEGYFTNAGNDFYGPGRKEDLRITHTDGDWQAMKIVGDSNVPRGKISFKTIGTGIEASLTDFAQAVIQIRYDTENEDGYSWVMGSIRFEKLSDKWFIQYNGETKDFSRCHKMEAMEAAKLPDCQ